MYISELGRRAKASPKAIRLYESLGLLGEVGRKGSYRVYSEQNLRQVQLIRQVQALGFRLADMGPLLLAAHASEGTFGSALAQAYADAARQAGHEVELLALDRLAFDPILHHGYKVIQELEPDLNKAQELITWANHLVFAFPVWWGGIPALLKAFLDRTRLPGFAFKYRKGKAFPAKLLSGRTAHLLVTMDTPPWYYRLVYRAPALHQMKKTTLGFCGITPLGTLMCGPILDSTTQQRAAWLARARGLAGRL